MTAFRIALIGCSLIFCIYAPAQAEIQTQHVVDSSVSLGPLEPLWHVRVRTHPQGGGVSQVRTGPILNFDVQERATLIVGYYYTRAKGERSWNTTHRTFGGVEVAAVKQKVEIDVRCLVERFGVAGPDYTRFRNRIRISPPGATAPYIGFESFLDADGLRSVRYSAGIRRVLSQELIMDIGYFYENRQSRAGTDRHVVGTTIHWRDKSTRLDSDR